MADPVYLVLFCRRPLPGSGKQRLARSIGPGPAARVAELLLAAALEDLADWPGPVVLSPAAAADRDWAASLLERSCEVIPQPEGNLGERLNAVDRALRARGARRIIYIGSDSPCLDAPYYAAARQALDTADAVLGPATDGGVTLMGARERWPDLAKLPWSTAQLGGELAGLCTSAGWRLTSLDRRADVDRSTDLQDLTGELQGDTRPARQHLLAWCEENGIQAVPG